MLLSTTVNYNKALLLSVSSFTMSTLMAVSLANRDDDAAAVNGDVPCCSEDSSSMPSSWNAPPTVRATVDPVEAGRSLSSYLSDSCGSDN